MKEWELWMSLIWLSWHEEDSASTSRAFISLLLLLNDYRWCVLPFQHLWGRSSLLSSSTITCTWLKKKKNQFFTLLAWVSLPKFCLNLKFSHLKVKSYSVCSWLCSTCRFVTASHHLISFSCYHPNDTKNRLFQQIPLTLPYPVFITY